MTLNDAEPGLPAASVALHVTSVVATGNVEPDAGKQETDRMPLTASVAVGSVNVTTLPPSVSPSAAAISGTLEKTGPTVSWTVMLNDARAVLPATSVALQDTSVEPSGKVEPDAGAQEGVITDGPLRLSPALVL